MPMKPAPALRAAVLTCLVTASAAAAPFDKPGAGQHFRSDTIAQRALKQFEGADGIGKDGPMSRLGYDLALVYEEHIDYRARGGKAGPRQAFRSRLGLARIEDDMILLDAAASADAHSLGNELAVMGMQGVAISGRTVSGWLPISQLPRLAHSGRLQLARPSYAITHSGVTTSQGDMAQTSDIARALHGLDGSGVTVGVLSDSFDCKNGAAGDVAGGDLPAGIIVLQEISACGEGTDEGRAMMQIVHDVAPGASQVFHSAFNGAAAFANGIVALATAGGADIITDDVIYLAEPMFQDGEIAQAVDTVNGLGVTYFSSAGNSASKSYEAGFVDSGESGYRRNYTRHDFDPTEYIDTMQAVTIPNNQEVTFVLQWQDPAFSVSGSPGAATDMDIYLYNEAGSFALAGSSDNNIGGDPVEVFSYRNDSGVDQTYQITIEHVRGPFPDKIKYVYYGSMGIQEYPTNSSTLYGHANAAGAIATGAARYDRTPAFGTSPPVIEGFSSRGGTPILFDTAGTPVNEPLRQKPEIVAPDGGNNTFFGSDYDGDGFPNFFGTSASAPHAAGAAALLKQLDPTQAPSAILAAMTSTAIDMNGAGFDYRSGYGLLQADAALATIDADADGTFNADDNCPEVANPLQEDFDGDGEGDACDADDDNDGLADIDEDAAGSDAYNPDDDGDGISDGSDNCILVSNAGQADTDSDGYGNACDPDFDNNGIVNAADLAYFKTRFFTDDPDADLNGNGTVNAADLAILKTMFFKAPGPAAIQFQ